MAHNNLGMILADRKQLDEAIAHYQKALEIKPDDVDAHNNLGSALVEPGRFDEAIAQFRKALEITPDYADAHNNLGVAILTSRGRSTRPSLISGGRWKSTPMTTSPQ